MIRKIKDILLRNSFIKTLYYENKKKASEGNTIIEGNNNIFNNKGICSNIRRKIKGNNNFIEASEGVNLSNIKIVIIGDNNKINIGADTYIDQSVFWIQGNNCSLIIGKNVSVESASFAVVEDNQSIDIGDECMLAYGIELKTSDSHSILDAETRERINPAQSIKINNHVWIGANVTLLKGVVVGKDSIVGTGAIVTRNIPENSLAVGVPAKVIRLNVTWKRELV